MHQFYPWVAIITLRFSISNHELERAISLFSLTFRRDLGLRYAATKKGRRWGDKAAGKWQHKTNESPRQLFFTSALFTAVGEK